MIQRKKTTIFIDAKESTKVIELKRMVQGITKKSHDQMKLFNANGQPLDDHKTLADVGYTSSTARAQLPASIGMTFKQESGEFEELEIAPLSTPPDLPDVMKQQDPPASHATEQVAS